MIDVFRTSGQTTRSLLLTMIMLLSLLAGCTSNSTDVESEYDELKGNLQSNTTEDGNLSIQASASGGNEPYSYVWFLDGSQMLTMDSRMTMGGLSPGEHVVGVTIKSSDGQLIDLSTTVVVPQPNRAPTCSLFADASVLEGQIAYYELEVHDADGDELTNIVELDDGTSSDLLSGSHSWNEPGSKTLTATTTDPEGLSASCTAQVQVVANKAPVLSVTTDPESDGTLILSTGQPLVIEASATDDENDDIEINIAWDDQSVDASTTSISWSQPGDYSVVVTASDAFGSSTLELAVEVIEEFNESDAFSLFKEQFDEDVDPTAELDADGDDNVDDAEDALDEEGLDVDETFSVDDDGEAQHDSGELDSWERKELADVGEVADSNDTSGAARDSGDDDPLLDDEGRTSENETSMDSPVQGLNAEDELRDDLFENSNPMEVLEDEDSMEGDVYEELAASVGAAWFNDTFQVDHDGDGSPDTDCARHAAAHWLDADHDGNAERAILYRVTACGFDADADGVNEVNMVEIEGLNWTDWSDDGVPEVIQALRIEVVTWFNNSHASKDVNTVLDVVAVANLDQDDNEEYLLIGHVEARQVDIDSDGVLEGEVLDYNVAFAEDWDDDGVPEEALLLKLVNIRFDLDGDGNVNTDISWVKAVYATDFNQDGDLDRYDAIQYGVEKWDNNSDGAVDGHTATWLGVGMEDTDFDGSLDRVTMATGHQTSTDADGDGISEKEVEYFAASRVKDRNGDGAFDTGWYLHYAREVVDSDDDGLAESASSASAGARAWDYDSDGNIDRFVALRYFEVKENETSPEQFQKRTSALWLLETSDWDDDGNLNAMHAVKTFSTAWDNNSDGKEDTFWTHAQGFYAQDSDNDQHMDRVVYVEYTSAQNDDDADGELGLVVESYTIHVRHSSPVGMSHEWYMHSSTTKVNVSVDGIAWYQNSTVVAYETWDDISTKETHAYVASYESVDNERDGSKEHEAYSVRDNRVSE